MKMTLSGIIALLLFIAAAWSGPADPEIDLILSDYFKIQSALAGDTTSGIDAAARSIEEKTADVDSDTPEIKKLISEIRTAARRIQGQDIKTARAVFFDLSCPLLVYVNQYHSNKEAINRFYCPMAEKGWLQAEKAVRNPYYGGSMLACGQRIERR